MAIRDLQERLSREEANSGEALFKKLEKELNAVYIDARGWRKYIGFNTEGTKGNWATYDSYWEEAYKEIKSESKAAVKAKKSAKAKEVLGDLQSLVKDIAGTEGITVPIGEAVQRLVSVVQPYIEERITALKKGEGIITTMRKNAIQSAVSAVEGFASATLAPLPFGAGDAILSKAKGLLGSNKERRSEQAMGFISRVNENLEDEEGMQTTRASAKKSGGIASSIKKSNDEAEEQGGEVVELLTNIDKNTQYIADNMEDAESRRERLRKQGVKVAGGAVAGAGVGMPGGDEGGPGFLESVIGGWLGWKAIRSIFTGKGGLLSNLARNLKAIFLKQGKNLLGTAKLLPLLRKAGTFAKIGGLSIPILGFAIDALLGAFEAEDWGVSVPSATIGGFFAGGEGGGWNMFGQAFKYGAMGGAIGSIVPGVGTIAGIILGSIIGALMGWVGGKKFAQSLDDAISNVKLTQETVNTAVKNTLLSESTKKKIETGEELTLGEGVELGAVESTAAMAEATAGAAQVIVETAKTIDPTYDRSTGKTVKWMPDIVRRYFPQGIFSGAFIQALSASESQIYNSPEELKKLKEKPTNNYMGGKFATGGVATVHPGEEVIEAAEVSRIERALAGQTLNTAAMDRVGLRFGGNVGMGGTPTMIDQSVTNLSNTTITPMVTRGQMLPGESSSIRPRAAF